MHHYIRDHICQPLGMTSTSFALDEAQRARLTRVHLRQADGSLTVMDWPVGAEPGYCMGGGGICSTARDYLTFLRALLAGGALPEGNKRILRPETVAAMGQNSMGALDVLPMRSGDPVRSNDCEMFPGMVKKWGLGFLINTEAAPNGGRSAGSLAWAGLGNTYFWLDPARRVAGIILMQILPFADPEALGLLDRFERAIYASL